MSFLTALAKWAIVAIFLFIFEGKPLKRTDKSGRNNAAVKMAIFLLHTATYPLQLDTLISPSKLVSTETTRTKNLYSEKIMTFQTTLKFPHFQIFSKSISTPESYFGVPSTVSYSLIYYGFTMNGCKF